MTNQRPPTIDTQAARRWEALPVAGGLKPEVQPASPWLHEEVARRMEERLQWIVKKPGSWLHWQVLRGGIEAHALLRRRYAAATSFVQQDPPQALELARAALRLPWWSAQRWKNPTRFEAPSRAVDLLWANMALHMSPDPQALIQRWHSLVQTDGFLMFSCLGPDTLRELRDLYARQDWPAPAHEFTDMHDWGDMLVQAGFAEPVMDMERITLSFSSPATLLAELRGLGRNLHPQRFAGLRGRAWRAALYRGIAAAAPDPDQPGRLRLSFEIIYGHAFKPAPRMAVHAQTLIPLEQMRESLRAQGPR
jgi:malonyl-CoA O-methyltransferase